MTKRAGTFDTDLDTIHKVAWIYLAIAPRLAKSFSR